MVVIAGWTCEELVHGLSCFGVLNGEQIVDRIYVQERLDDFTELAPARSIGNE